MNDMVQSLSHILDFIASQKTDVSINQIATALSMNRHSAAKNLTILHMLGRVEHRSYGKVKLFRLSKRVPYSAIKQIWDGLLISLERSYIVKEVYGEPLSFFPYSLDKIIGKNFLHITNPISSNPNFLENLCAIIEGKTNEPFLTEFHNQKIWYSIKIMPSVFEDGSFGAVILVFDISEKKQLQSELDRWKEKYQALIRDPFEMVLSLSSDKKINSANETYLAFFQTSINEIRGTDHFFRIFQENTIHPSHLGPPMGTIGVLSEERENGENFFKTITPDNPSRELSTPIMSPDGTIFWKKWVISAIFSGNQLIEYQVSGSDITQRVALENIIQTYEKEGGNVLKEKVRIIEDLEEKILREQDQRKKLLTAIETEKTRYNLLLQCFSDYIWEVDPVDTIVTCSPEFANLLGFPYEEVKRKPIYKFLIPESILKLRLFFSQAKKFASRCSSLEIVFQTYDNQFVSIEVSGIPTYAENGEVTGFLLIGRNISKRKQIEEEKERQTHLLESITDFVGIMDRYGKILFLNKQGRRLLNIPEDQDLHAYNILQFISSRSTGDISNGISTAIQTGSWRGDSIIRSSHGEEIPVSHIIFSHESGIAQDITFSMILRDKRESIFHEREIAQINSYNRSLIESSLDPMITISIEGKIQDTNKATELITGLKRINLIGKRFSEISANPDNGNEIIQGTLNSESLRNYRLDILHQNGKITPVLYNGTIYRDEIGNVRGILATIRDITAQLETEYELRDSLQYYLTILNGFPNPIWRVSPDGQYDYFNKAWLEFTGRSWEDEIGEGWMAGIHPNHIRLYHTLFKNAMENKVPFYDEFKLLYNDGRYHQVKIIANPLFSHDKSFMGFIGSCYDMDQIKRSEEVARKIEREQSYILDSSHEQIIFLDPDLRIQWVNKVAEEYIGTSSDNLYGCTCYSILQKRETQCPNCHVMRAKNTKISQECQVIMPDGQIFHSRANAILNEIGEVVALIEINQDITKQIELNKEKEQLLGIIEKTPDIIGISDRDGNVLYLNAAGKRILNISEETDIRTLNTQLFHPPHLKNKLLSERLSAIDEGVWVGESELQSMNGRVFPVSQVVLAHHSEPDKTMTFSTIIRDITNRIQVEGRLRKSELKFRQLHDNLMDAFIAVDMDGRITEFNDVFQQMIGYEPEEILNLTFRDLTPEQWHDLELEIVKNQVIPRGYSDIYEKEYRKRDGTVFPVELRTILLRDADGSPIGMWAIVNDITKRKQIWNLLKDKKEQLRIIIESVPAMIGYLDTQERYRFVNKRYADWHGNNVEFFKGKQLRSVISVELYDLIISHYRKALLGHKVSFECLTSNYRNELRLLDVNLVPHINGLSRIPGIFIFIQDISGSERKILANIDNITDIQ